MDVTWIGVLIVGVLVLLTGLAVGFTWGRVVTERMMRGATTPNEHVLNAFERIEDSLNAIQVAKDSPRNTKIRTMFGDK